MCIRDRLYTQFPIVNYGLDIQYMAMREKGVIMPEFHAAQLADYDPPQPIKEKVEEFMKTKQNKKWDIVPLKLVGKGEKAYVVKDWVVYRGKGSGGVNTQFRNIVQLDREKREWLNDRIKARLSKGPRVASKGFGIK
eukprot:TRINITY_DN5153_c0_g2_i7.p3 TRINITY_DN5153_c0_g2~~TRINITY_DN5153_c0_g2_i7.p3  ORF type:complete len:137 (+),score=36.97 TRINITY_DN5153_c0_g2_i7:65-475(+)